MKKTFAFIAALVILGLLVSNITLARALPPLPSSYYGTVKINGANVPADTIVSAWINGGKFAYSAVTLISGQTVYSLDVPGDDPFTTDVVEGGVEGDIIVFHIGNLVANQTATWHIGTNVSRNISVTTCYLLTLSHSGHGTDPVASPTHSNECVVGKYLAGQAITLSGATAELGWQISGWTGTANDVSTASVNVLTMPAENHQVSVNYIEDKFPPAVPTLKYPAADAALRRTPTYAWNAGGDATAFRFEYDDNSGFTSPNFTSAVITTTNYKPPKQAFGTYYWHVKARDAAGNWSNWSAYRKITIKPLIPVAPVLVSPVSGKFTNDTTPTFTWKTVPDGNKYRIQISKTSNFTTPILVDVRLKPGVLTYTPLPLADGKYYWRVKGINVLYEGGTWSATRNITIDTVKPAAPLLSYPKNGAIVIGIPTYKWQAVTGARYYQFSHATNSKFSLGLFTSARLTVLSYKPVNQLKRTYYWRVRAQDAAGNWSSWSIPRKVTIE